MFPLNFILFLQIIIFLFITPGTPRIVIVSYSMNYGVRNCIWTALGDITANFIQATLVIFVIGSFFSAHPLFLNTFTVLELKLVAVKSPEVNVDDTLKVPFTIVFTNILIAV